MDNFQGFVAVVLAGLCLVFTLLVLEDLHYIAAQRNPFLYLLFCACVIGLTGGGAYYLW